MLINKYNRRVSQINPPSQTQLSHFILIQCKRSFICFQYQNHYTTHVSVQSSILKTKFEVRRVRWCAICLYALSSFIFIACSHRMWCVCQHQYVYKMIIITQIDLAARLNTNQLENPKHLYILRIYDNIKADHTHTLRLNADTSFVPDAGAAITTTATQSPPHPPPPPEHQHPFITMAKPKCSVPPPPLSLFTIRSDGGSARLAHEPCFNVVVVVVVIFLLFYNTIYCKWACAHAVA